VRDATESRDMMLAVLENKPGAPRETVVLNAGAALYAANRVEDIASGIKRAREVIESGAARAKVDEFVRVTRRLGGATTKSGA